MEFFKIMGLGVVAAAVYGIANNLVTATYCIEFFCLFPADIETSSPLVVALTYGVLATWWLGLLLGLGAASAARLGGPPRLNAVQVVKPIALLATVVAATAAIAGFVGYLIAEGFIGEPALREAFACIPLEKHRAAFAVNAAHLGAYGSGSIGGIGLCVTLVMRRSRLASSPDVVTRAPEGDTRFDAFLCHNSEDKPAVRKVNEALKEGGVRTWLDEEQLPLGRPWQKELARRISEVRCALVFIGSEGIGPWQGMEMSALLDELVGRDCPVIPVILPEAGDVEIEVFLKQLTWIDLRREEERGIRRLIGEIRGALST